MIDASYGDSTQLLYLRSRYYNPADGRFQSRDTWGGDSNRLLSFNRWNYVDGNPVNLTDPTGNDPWWCPPNSDCEKDITMSRNIPSGYLCVDTNGDMYCDTYVREDTEYRNYDARDYALAHYLDNPGIIDNDCANFVSAALHAGGKSQTADWWAKDLAGNSSTPWKRTGHDPQTPGGSLYEYLILTHNVEIFNNTAGTSLRGNLDWENWIAVRLLRIRPGDIVFYNDSTYQLSWIHAAIVTVNNAEETMYLTSTITNNKKPLIVEHTGPLQNNGLAGSERSIDDTNNGHLGAVAIVHMKELR